MGWDESVGVKLLFDFFLLLVLSGKGNIYFFGARNFNRRINLIIYQKAKN